jgi:hypothetical protein
LCLARVQEVEIVGFTDPLRRKLDETHVGGYGALLVYGSTPVVIIL